MSGASRAAALGGLAACFAAPSALAAPGVELADLSSVILSLALVIGFIFAAAWIVRRTPFARGGRASGPLKVIAALPLGARERLLLVQARDRELLIAVSPAGVFNVSATTGTSLERAASQPPQEPKFVLGEQP